nr:nucleotidyltransferase domain-containing protein [Candidatus Njordarchaeota archaeon]
MRTIDEIKGIVAEAKKRLVNNYETRIRKVIIYGSFARGEATKDSDIDILVVVDDALEPFDVRESLNDFLTHVLLEKGELVSVQVVPESEFRDYNSPFLMNVRAEGVPV